MPPPLGPGYGRAARVPRHTEAGTMRSRNSQTGKWLSYRRHSSPMEIVTEPPATIYLPGVSTKVSTPEQVQCGLLTSCLTRPHAWRSHPCST